MKKIKKWCALAMSAALAVSMFAGCGKKEIHSELDPEAVLVTVGGEEITVQEAYFMVKWQQSRYQTMASQMYGPEWYKEDLEGNGQTFLDYIKGSIANMIEDMQVCSQYAKENNIELTEDEKKKVDETVKTFMNSNTDEAHAAMMSDEETVRNVLEKYTLYYKVFNSIVKDADTTVTEEEAQQKTYSYIYQSLTTQDEEGNTVNLSDAQAQKYFEAFAAVKDEADASGDFDKAAENHGFSPASHSYAAQPVDGDTDSFSDINSIADELQVGETSKLIQVEGGLFLIHLDTELDEEKTEAARQTKAYEKQAAYFEEQIAPLREAANITWNEELWAQIDFEEPIQAVQENE